MTIFLLVLGTISFFLYLNIEDNLKINNPTPRKVLSTNASLEQEQNRENISLKNQILSDADAINQDHLSNKIDKTPKATTTDISCDYQTPCQLKNRYIDLSLSVTSPPIQAEEWIEFTLESVQSKFKIVKAQITGKSMFMGRIPVFFTEKTPQKYVAKTLVGACTTDKMIWQLGIDLEIKQDNGKIKKERVFFDFVISN